MNQDALAYLAITRLYAAYADVVTRRAWGALDPLFLPDAPIHLDTVTAPVTEIRGPAAFGQFVSTSIERFEFFEFVILNHVVEVLDEDTARGRLYMVELRQDRDSHEWSNAFGLYQDRFARVDGSWRFAERAYRSLARRTGGPADAVFPFPTTTAD